MAALKEDLVSVAQESVKVDTEADTELGSSFLSMLLPGSFNHMQVAFIYQMDSMWFM